MNRPKMPNDAKLGLVAGVALVLLIMVVFFRRDPSPANAAPELATPAAVNSARLDPKTPPVPAAAPSPPVAAPVTPIPVYGFSSVPAPPPLPTPAPAPN